MDQKSAHFKKNHFAANLTTRVALCFVAVFVIGAVLVLCVHVSLTNHRMAAMEETLEGLRQVVKGNANISDSEFAAKHELRAIKKRSVGNNTSPNPPNVETRLQALEQRSRWQRWQTWVSSDSRVYRQQGIQGRDGRDGRDGAPGPRGPPGQQGLGGKMGCTGTQGLPGPQGEKGQEGQGLSGVKYAHWGRTQCSGNATVVYSGIMGGDRYSHSGGGSNFLCLPNNPLYGSLTSGWQAWASIFGTEYETSGFNGFKNNLHDHEAPCAVCYVKSRGSQLMIPARNVCPSGWTREYHGYLMTAHYNHKHSSEYVCVDVNAEVVPGTQSNTGSAALLYVVQSHCGALPCQPYVQGHELTCAVCTK